MAEKAREYVNFTLTEAVPTAFVFLVSPQAFKDKGKEKGNARYSGTFIFDPNSTDLKNLKALVAEKLKESFPGKKLVPRRLTQEEVDGGAAVEVNLPWMDGTKFADKPQEDGTKRDNSWARGKVLVKVGSDDKHPPALSMIENGKIVEFNDPAVRSSKGNLFYSGAFVVAQFGLNIYPARDNKPGGCSLWPRAVCFVKHGPRTTGGGINQAEVFRAYAGTVSTVDPTANELDDEIPF